MNKQRRKTRVIFNVFTNLKDKKQFDTLTEAKKYASELLAMGKGRVHIFGEKGEGPESRPFYREMIDANDLNQKLK